MCTGSSLILPPADPAPARAATADATAAGEASGRIPASGAAGADTARDAASKTGSRRSSPLLGRWVVDLSVPVRYFRTHATMIPLFQGGGRRIPLRNQNFHQLIDFMLFNEKQPNPRLFQ